MKIRLFSILASILILSTASGRADSYSITIRQGFSLIANHLDAGINNTLDEVLPGVPNGTQICKYNCTGDASQACGAGYTSYTKGAGGWTPSSGTLKPGEGAWIINNSGADFQLTFTGMPHVPVLPASLPCGCGQFNILACQTNQIGTFENIMGISPPNFARVYIFNNVGLTVHTYDEDLGGWENGAPMLAVGQSAVFLIPACSTAPVRTCASDKTVTDCSAWSFDAPTDIIVCNANYALTFTTVTNSGPCPLVTTRTWVIRDVCGNSNTCSQRVTVNCCTNPCVPPPPNMVAWWTGDGHANDIIGPNNGGLQNGATYAPGKVGSAFSFDGVDDIFQAPTTGLPTGNSDRTIDLWVKIDAFVAAESFFAGYGIFGEPTKSYSFGLSGSTLVFSQWGAAVFGPPLSLNTWYHVAVATIGNNVSLYLNGALVASGTLAINTSSGSQFYMGTIAGPLGDGRKLKGQLDEVEVFNRALTASEIQAIYNAGSSGKCKPCPITFACATNKTVPCGSNWSFDAPANIIDTCCTNYSLTFSTVTNSGFCPLVFTRTWLISDTCGHSKTCTQTVTVVNTTPPVFTNCPPPTLNLGCNPTTIPDCDPNVGAINGCGPGTLPSYLLVTSYYTSNVMRYNGTSGAFIDVFASGGGLTGPEGLLFGPDDKLYVSSADADEVTRYDGATGVFLDKFVSAASGGLNGPVGLAFGLNGKLYVSSYYTADVKSYMPPGTFTSGPGPVNPQGLVFGPDRHLYVCSRGTAEVKRYHGTSGLFMDNFVSAGSGLLTEPVGLVFGPDCNLYVSSFGSGGVKRYNGTTGAFIDKFASANASGGLTFGPDGNLYVCSFDGDEVTRYNGKTGALMGSFASGGGLNGPTFLTFTPSAPVVTSAKVDTANGCTRTRRITYTAVDSCHNTNTCTQVITWTVDTTPPVITCTTKTITVPLNANCQMVIPRIPFTAFDICTPARQLIVHQSPAIGTPVAGPCQTVTVTVTDLCGNFMQCQVRVCGLDTTGPVLSGPTNLLVTNCLVPCVTSLVTAIDKCCPQSSLRKTQSPLCNTPIGPGMRSIVVTVTDCKGKKSTHTILMTLSGPRQSFLTNNLYNTGVSNNGSLLPPAAADPHYTLGPVPTGTTMGAGFYTSPNALATGQKPWNLWPYTKSQWITTSPNPGQQNPMGVYYYTNTFTVPLDADLKTASISGKWAADNDAGMYLNGLAAGNFQASTAPSKDLGYLNWHPFTLPPGKFVLGLNKLYFTVTNQGFQMALRVEYQSATVNCYTCAPPAILSISSINSVPKNGVAALSVAISGTPPLSYQWYHNGAALQNVSPYSGVTTRNLLINPVNYSDAGLYTVVVFNLCGSVTGKVNFLVSQGLAASWGSWNVAQLDHPLAASFGPDLILKGTSAAGTNFAITSGTTEDFELPQPGGQLVNVMHIAALPVDTSIQVPRIAPPGSNTVHSYTVIMDLYQPADSAGTPSTLFQAGPCICPDCPCGGPLNDGQDGPRLTVDAQNNLHLTGFTAGASFDVASAEPLPTEAWTRLALVVDDPQDGVAVNLYLYLNGRAIASVTLPTTTGLPINWSNSPPTLLSRQTNDVTLNGDFFLSGVQFHAVAFASDRIAGLGSPDNGPIPANDTSVGATPVLSATVSNRIVNLSWTGSPFVLQETTDLSSGDWVESVLPFTQSEVNGDIFTSAVADSSIEGPSKFYRLVFKP